jgi:hypothetical protein
VILIILWLLGAALALISALAFESNGWALIGLVLMAPATARGVTHDLIFFLPYARKAVRPMDTGYTYSSKNLARASIYAPPEFDVPDELVLTIDGNAVTFFRLSDRSLECGKAPGVSGECTNLECHRRSLGECDCGRHEAPRFTKAVQS